jgi:hypothetical protein
MEIMRASRFSRPAGLSASSNRSFMLHPLVRATAGTQGS